MASSGGGGRAWMDLGGPMDGLAGLVHGLSFFCFPYLINGGRRPTDSFNARLTVAFCWPPKRLFAASFKFIVVLMDAEP